MQRNPSVLVQKLDQHRIHDFRIFIKTHMRDAFKGMKLRLRDVLQNLLTERKRNGSVQPAPHQKDWYMAFADRTEIRMHIETVVISYSRKNSPSKTLEAHLH